jgi:hypothetical protein
VTINVERETQNRGLEPTGLAKRGEIRGLTGTGPGLSRQESAGRVFGRFWNHTDLCLRSKPRPLAGYPDPFLTLGVLRHSCQYLLCPCVCQRQVFKCYAIPVYIGKCHHGTLVFTGYQSRSGFFSSGHRNKSSMASSANYMFHIRSGSESGVL